MCDVCSSRKQTFRFIRPQEAALTAIVPETYHRTLDIAEDGRLPFVCFQALG
jgi:hypothetical protein